MNTLKKLVILDRDGVINADDLQVRANRLALLSELHAQMNCVADISKLAA